jgi:hypothetical protein
VRGIAAGLRAALAGAVAATALVALAPRADAAPVGPIFNEAIDDYADYDGADTCDPTDKPGPQKFRDLLERTYPETRIGGIGRACGGGSSEHYEGRAYDWMVDAATQSHIADDLFTWLFATDSYGNRHAMVRRLGIMYIIWDREIWRAYAPERGWQPYDGSNPHTDHVHFSFSWDGAYERTSYTTGVGPALRLDQGRFAATWRDRKHLDVLRRAAGGELEHRTWTPRAGWSGWDGAGGDDIDSAPAAAWVTPNRLVAVALLDDDRLAWRRWRPGGWTEWRRLGGRVTSAPAVASRDGRLDVFARDRDGSVLHKTWTEARGWKPWADLGGTTTSVPAAGWRTGRILHVFARSTSGQLEVRTLERGTWSGWSSLGGALTSGPAASSGDPGALNVFVRSDDGTVRHRYTTGGWSAWYGLGGSHASGPVATSVRTERMDLFTRARSGGLNQNFFTRSSGWSGWRVW